MNFLRRRRLLYSRAYAAGRAAGRKDFTLTVRYNGQFVAVRVPVDVLSMSPTIPLGSNLILMIQDEKSLS